MTSVRPGDEQLVVAAKSARRVVVGDVVALDAEAGRIEAILPAAPCSSAARPGEQGQVAVESRAVAANMDRVLVLQPLDVGLNLATAGPRAGAGLESGRRPSSC